jgi:hypothetical protein
MIRVLRATWLAILLVPFSACSRPASQQAIECPVLQTGHAAGTVKESASEIASAGHQLQYGNSNAITEVAASFRKRHPDASKGAVINYLLTAYCPSLNADGALDQNARRDAMKNFARQAEATLR